MKKTKKRIELKQPAWLKKLLSWIDITPNDVAYSRRLGAYAIDWAVGGILTGFPAVILYAAVTKRTDYFSDLYVFPSLGYSTMWSYLVFALCLVMFMFYFVYVPSKMHPGQTLGKRIMKIKVTNMDNNQPTPKQWMQRQVIGLLILEGSATIMSTYLREVLTLATGTYFEYSFGYVAVMITMISAVLVFATPSHRSIHDYISKTKVENA